VNGSMWGSLLDQAAGFDAALARWKAGCRQDCLPHGRAGLEMAPKLVCIPGSRSELFRVLYTVS
jgi:hypothetical protein